MSIIDVWTFRLAGDVDEGIFLEADRRVQERYMLSHPGFLRRTTARGDDGEWAVIMLWRSRDEAEAPEGALRDDPVVAAFASLLDPSSVGVHRYATLD